MALTKEQLVKEVMEAVDCAARGESHPRLINYMERSLVERQRRAELLTLTPRPVDTTPRPAVDTNAPLDPSIGFDSFGPGGAKRND